jgi:hypothetical protein
MLKYSMTISMGGKVRFSSSNYQRKYIKFVIEKIDIEYDDIINSDYV